MEKHVLILGCKNYPGFSSNKVISSGMEVYVTELVKYLKKCFKITIITADSEVTCDDRVRVISVPIFGGRLLQPITLLLFSIFPSFRLRRQIALINAQTPLSGFIAYVLKKWCRIPYIVSVHMYANSKDHTGHRLLSAMYHYIEKCVYSAADKIVCAGYGLGQHIMDQHRIDQDRVTVINPGTGPVELDTQMPSREASEKYANPDGLFRVLFLGRLIQENGIMDLLESIKHLVGQPVKLLIAGNGNLETVIRRYVEKEQLQDQIELIGIVTGDDKKALLGSVDLLIRTSYHEVFPVAYLEALAHGVPVVATAVGDTEYMAKQTGGIDLVPVHDPPEIAAAIVRQMHNEGLDPEVISRCKTYLQSISWRSQADKTICLFNDVLSTNGSVREEL